MARTIGKAMAEFRRTTNDFKETWQKEVDFEEFREETEIKTISEEPKTIAQMGKTVQNQIATPEIKEINAADFEHLAPMGSLETGKQKRTEKIQTEKQNWL
jgi:Sec-independent protein translocase protein TatA